MRREQILKKLRGASGRGLYSSENTLPELQRDEVEGASLTSPVEDGLLQPAAEDQEEQTTTEMFSAAFSGSSWKTPSSSGSNTDLINQVIEFYFSRKETRR